MFTLLKIVHVLALMFGSAASFGNLFLLFSAGPHDLAAPGFTNRLRKIYRLTALIAIGAFWFTGLLMVFLKHGMWVYETSFNIKVFCAFVLTISVIFLNIMAPGWSRSGGLPSYVGSIHWLNAGLLIVIVILASFTFG